MKNLPENELTRLHKDFCYFKTIYENVTTDTIRWYTTTFKMFLNFLEDNYYSPTLDAINKESIMRYLEEGITKKNWSKNTLVNYHKAIKSFATWLTKNKHLSKNPFDEIPKPKPEESLPKYLTLEESRKLLNWIANYDWHYSLERMRNLAMFATFLYTGVRLSELLNIKLEDINLAEDYIRVNKGKGKRDRVIPVCEKLKRTLVQYYQERQHYMRKCEYFFVSSNRDSRLTINGVKKVFKRLNDQQIIPKHIYPHLLRHTAATLVLSGSGDLRSVQTMLGHSTLTMTLKYASCTQEHLAKQMNKNPL